MLRTSRENTSYIDPSSADVYHQSNELQFQQACRFISANAAHFASPILDIGCGDGRVSAYMASSLQMTVTGLDISQDRVNFANTKYGTSELTFVVGNALALNETPSVAHQLYNTIVSFNAVHHFPKSRQTSFFKQVYEKLEQGGAAVFLIPGPQDYHEPIIQAAQLERWQPYFVDLDFKAVRTYEHLAYYRELAKEAGFHDESTLVEVEEPGLEMNFEGLKKYYSGWLPHLAHLKTKNVSVAMQDAFVTDVVRLYFIKNNKKLDETVNISLWQNKMVLFKRETSKIDADLHHVTHSILK